MQWCHMLRNQCERNLEKCSLSKKRRPSLGTWALQSPGFSGQMGGLGKVSLFDGYLFFRFHKNSLLFQIFSVSLLYCLEQVAPLVALTLWLRKHRGAS